MKLPFWVGRLHRQDGLPKDIYISLVGSLYQDGRTLFVGSIGSSAAALITAIVSHEVWLLMCAIAMPAVAYLRVLDLRQFQRNVKSVGDDGQGMNAGSLNSARDLSRGSARVEDDRLIRPNQVGGSMPDTDLLGVVNRLLEAKRIIYNRIQLPYCPTVRPQRVTSFRQCIEVSASRYRRNLEPTDNVFDGDSAVALQDFPYSLAPFFGEQSGLFL